MNTKALWSVAVLSTVAAFFSACGDGDSTKIKICNAKQSTCLTDTGGQVCSADGTLNLPFQCGQGQRCCDPSVKDANCGEDVTKTSCVGDCTPGDTQCGSKGVSLRCSDDGRSWVPTDCPVGTGCDDNENNEDTYGTCVNSDDPGDVVVVCTGGDTACADGNTAKTCEPDGTNWVYTACATNEVCDDGACVLDPAKGCVPHSGTCEDKTHLKMCNDAGDGYAKTITCLKGTTCEDGACQGPVCPIGAIRCDDVRVGGNFVNALGNGTYQPQSVYACNKDGTGWDISTCPSSEICIYDNISRNTIDTYVQALLTTTVGAYPVLSVPTSSRASCEAPQCASPFLLRNFFGGANSATAGSFTCGDALDLEDDPLGSYSLCEGLPPYNNLYWANYACKAPEQCVYQGSPNTVEDGYITGPTCAATCVPGAQACTSPGNGQVGAVTTAGEATVTCGDEGTWDYSTVKPCESDDHREFWCGPNLQGTADNFNIGTCMEPACAAWFQAFDTFALPQDIGACGADGKFYPCKADGTFGDAQDCAQCTPAGSNVLPAVSTAPETFAGYDPGQCVTCAEGAQRCMFASGANPYYQVCNEDGTWSTKACSSSKLCWGYQDPDTALGSIVCGGECAPYTASCGGDDGKQIATCSKDGELSDFKPCPEGACHTDSTSSTAGGSAICEVECIAGTFLCPTALEAVACTSKGRYDVLNPKACDVSSLQKPESCYPKLGCAECDPGTFSGAPQMRCALDDNGLPAVPAAVEVCKDGHWDNSIECPGSGTSCYLGTCSSVEPPPGEGGNGGQGSGTSGQGGNN